jgi:glycerol-3-phosphate acyltransferase PlsX
MGGDRAPADIVAGAIEAVRVYHGRILPILVGDQPAIEAELDRLGGRQEKVEIVHAAERVEMDEGGAESFRKKRDSSLNVATRMVRDGAAQGVFSAGNTGAGLGR